MYFCLEIAGTVNDANFDGDSPYEGGIKFHGELRIKYLYRLAKLFMLCSSDSVEQMRAVS